MKEGKSGLLNRKTLELEHPTPPLILKDLPEVDKVDYGSWKHIKSERIQNLVFQQFAFDYPLIMCF